MQNKQFFILCLNVGPFEVNTYIIACPETLEGIIIDPGGEDERIIQAIDEKKINPKYIINTHGHRDHVFSNVSLSSHYNIPICMHIDDKLFFQELSSLQDSGTRAAYTIDIDLHHNDILQVGTLKIKVIHTPGHTPGSVCLYINNSLFSGDTLFVGNAGRTDLPGGNLDTLIHSIEKRIIPLSPDTILYPGHDYGDTPVSTIGREIKENIYITDFISTSS
ncbi:MAG: MBL fold metallo-hydrolase [Desulfobacula sp.]|uniref:MBL fold metallo-hydrolase n=1 Tax=Desulfobacula sp. TaxID=2593537 RepID=UPI0025C5C493|nr:MBL fold metallo-hydrolase [Desulfobacula sp.]MCD4722586.1 MBL fold metallo-hydrolase [Desulfobacula sp.]